MRPASLGCAGGWKISKLMRGWIGLLFLLLLSREKYGLVLVTLVVVFFLMMDVLGPVWMVVFLVVRSSSLLCDLVATIVVDRVCSVVL